MQDSSDQDIYWNTGGPKFYSEENITSAIDAGILSRESATLFKKHVAASFGAPAADEEYFRFLGGFNDIFVVIACTLLLVALAQLLGSVHSGLGALGVALAAWCLAEHFVRKKRLALTAIVLLGAFAGGVFLCILFLLDDVLRASDTWAMLAASAVTSLATWVHWRRFHVPVTVACGTCAVLGVIFLSLIAAFPAINKSLTPLVFCSGLTVLAIALRWDSRDTARQTRYADVAFWLHLLAAPLLVHPVFLSMSVFSGKFTISQAWIIVLLYVMIALISLCIDRRALMVSSLAYVLYALGVLFENYGMISLNFAVGTLAIGSALLLLSVFWHPMRARIVVLLPLGVQRHIPPARK